jgi:DNA-binding NarL/FixJ family response regulator
MEEIKVAIYEDNSKLRKSLELLIQNTSGLRLLFSVAHCLNIPQDINAETPDVVLMDINLPGKSGIEGARIIKHLAKQIDILMLTVFEDEDSIFKALEAGATGYLLKSASSKKIIEGIVELHNGGSPISATIARKVLRALPKISAGNTLPSSLTQREEEILKLLESGNSSKIIGSKLGISYETVRTHVKKIYEKLQVNSVTSAINKAQKAGWL